MVLTICNSISSYCFRLLGDWNYKMLQMIGEFGNKYTNMSYIQMDDPHKNPSTI